MSVKLRRLLVVSEEVVSVNDRERRSEGWRIGRQAGWKEGLTQQLI